MTISDRCVDASQLGEVLVRVQRSHGLCFPDRDLDRLLGPTLIVVGETRWSAGRVVCTHGEDAAAALGRVEPVHVGCTSSSTAPALGARAKDREQEAPAGVSSVSLALCARREVVELDGEAESSWEGAANAAVVVAEEVGAAASGGGREAGVAQCARHWGEGGKSEKSDRSSCCPFTSLSGELL